MKRDFILTILIVGMLTIVAFVFYDMGFNAGVDSQTGCFEEISIEFVEPEPSLEFGDVVEDYTTLQNIQNEVEKFSLHFDNERFDVLHGYPAVDQDR